MLRCRIFGHDWVQDSVVYCRRCIPGLEEALREARVAVAAASDARASLSAAVPTFPDPCVPVHVRAGQRTNGSSNVGSSGGQPRSPQQKGTP